VHTICKVIPLSLSVDRLVTGAVGLPVVHLLTVVAIVRESALARKYIKACYAEGHTVLPALTSPLRCSEAHARVQPTPTAPEYT
jgi:hypothetical protein